MRRKMTMLLVALLAIVSMGAVWSREEISYVKCYYLEESGYTDSVEIPKWARVGGVKVPTITTGTIDFYIHNQDVDGTGSPRYQDEDFTFHFTDDTTGSASSSETGYYDFTVSYSTTADILSASGQGSKCFQMNSSSTSVYYAYVDTSTTNYGTALNVGTGDFSLVFSMKHNTASDTVDGAVAYTTPGANDTGWRVEMETDGDIAFTIENTTGAVDVCRTTAATYDDNAWHRIGCTKSSSALRIYVDGVQIATSTVTCLSYGSLDGTTTNYFLIGKSSTTTTAENAKAWEGYLDGLSIFSGEEKSATFYAQDYRMFNEAQYAVVLQDAKGSDNQVSSGTGLFYLDLTDEIRALSSHMRLKFGASQAADRKIEFHFKN